MKKKIGKRHSISLGLPDRLNRTRVKSITYTKQGIIDDLKCPECDGEGVDLIDNTHARGGEMIPQLCSYCDGNGVITGRIKYDDDGNQHIIIKEGGHSHVFKK